MRQQQQRVRGTHLQQKPQRARRAQYWQQQQQLLRQMQTLQERAEPRDVQLCCDRRAEGPGCSVQHLLAHSIVTVEEIKEILNHFRIVEYSSEILDLLVTASKMFVSQ